jgi:L-malate glycosyltransferase
MKSKRILFICPYPENVAPSQRLKFEQYYEYFRESGYMVDTSAFISYEFWKIIYKKGNFFKKALFTFKGYFNRVKDLIGIKRYDLVYIHLWVTPFGPPLFEWLFNKFSRKIIYDIDDLIYLGHIKSRSHSIVSFIKGRSKPLFLMKHADHVITCTPYLDQFVKKINTNTTDISSTINTSLYKPKLDYSIKDQIIIGWSGSHSTSKYLHLLDDVLIDLSLTCNFKLVVMGDSSFKIDGVNVEAIPWKEEYEIDVIKTFDIGVYPLPDEEWVLGKSGLKALQYMALGIPTVATAIGTIFRIIKHSENGFLAKDAIEWKFALQSLIVNEELRKKIGVNGSLTVEENYSVNNTKSIYLSILNSIS